MAEDARVLADAVAREDRALQFYRLAIEAGRLGATAAALIHSAVNTHSAHREFLARAVTATGVAVPAPSPSGGVPTTVRDEVAALRAATDVEEGGMQGHLAAMTLLILPEHRKGLASIIAVQAQYVAMLRSLQRLDPVPHAFLGEGL